MNDLTLSIIEEARAKEKPEDVFLLEKDEVTQELILAWEKVGVIEFEYEMPEPPENMPAWQKLWRGAKVDLDYIAALSNIPRSKIEHHLEFAQTNFFIYPDGTAHRFALNLSRKTKILRMKEKGLT